MRKPRLMVLGHARHGKDSVCDILRDEYGLTFQSSSHFVAERAVRPYLAARGVHYTNFAAMYADRVNRRSDWFDAIAAYNAEDPARLGRELFELFDIYCGLRNVEEFKRLKADGVIDFTIWVDASKRLPFEPSSSMTLSSDCADHIIDNNGPLEELRSKVADAHAAATRKLLYGGVP